MTLPKPGLKTLAFVTRILANKELRFILPLIFANYTYLRLKRLLEMQLMLKSFPIEAPHLSTSPKNDYVDPYRVVLASDKLIKDETSPWYYICSLSSVKKYKVCILRNVNVASDELRMSETTLFNIRNYLNITPDSEPRSFFIIPASDKEDGIAQEVSLSLISNPYDCPEDLLDNLLGNYFKEARFISENDVLGIDIETFSPAHRFIVSRNDCQEIYFKVVNLKVDKLCSNPRKGCFVLRGVTTILQTPNVHSFIPSKDFLAFEKWKRTNLQSLNVKSLLKNCPPCLEDTLRYLESCLTPFIQNPGFVDINPVFLIEGSQGCGKFSLVQIAAKKIGMNFLNVDFCDIQSLTGAQTEAKIRIVLNNAKNCTPCILLLENIQIFGKDAEGKEDERTISSFHMELDNFFNKIELRFPVIVVATVNNSPIPATLRQIFIETIAIPSLSHANRLETLKWLLDTKGLKTDADLSHVAAICSDFVLADLNALILHAAKIRAGLIDSGKSLVLAQDDFSRAHELMQSRYSQWIGAPRIPKVYWEDIGGLAELKNEIIRRIELPLLAADGVGLSRSGLLLYGPPGTGKTLLAKAVATECQVHFLSVKGPELLNMYVGQSEKNVRQVFEIARSSSPCVIFFDELDSLAPNRGASGDSGGVMDRVVSQLLSEIDGVENNGDTEAGGGGGGGEGGGRVFIIGATNRPDLIDPALLRPGRFDKLLYVGISSDRSSKLSVLKALTRRFEFLESGAELDSVVDLLPDNLTGADIYAVCSNAWLLAVRRCLNERGNDYPHDRVVDKVTVTKQDFVKAAENVVPSVSVEELKRYEKLREELSGTNRSMRI